MLAEAEQLAALDATGTTGARLGELMRAKVAGRRLADALRPVLFPEDDDG